MRGTSKTTTRAGLAALAVMTVTGSLLLAPGASASTVAAAPAVVRTAGSTTTTTTVAGFSATDQRLRDRLTLRATDPLLGPDLTAAVTDAASGQLLWPKNRFARQMPASTTKLVTSVNTLETFGPDYRFTTRVRKGSTWNRVVLVGSGDPGLTSANLATLAAATATAVRAHGVRTVIVYVDDYIFARPSLAYGWKSTYVPADVSPVRALVVDQHRNLDTSKDAGKVFAAKLLNYGVRTSAVYRGHVTTGAPVLASVQGRRVDSMLGSMLRPSDNDYAEAFHRLVARRMGYYGTWSGASAAQRKVLLNLGVDLGTSTLYDGSGLSRADRLTADQLSRVLALAVNGSHPRLAVLPSLLPVAGRTGTLAPDYLRYTTWPTRCAAGLIQAKTGSLTGVISLAGYAKGADGRTKAFALLANGVPSTLTTRKAVDKLATTITGCW
jgi:serine-type D-Ala-D-Ala carboxypeptidase/endopeptidase (penicillin-binding protein 4)